MANTERTTRRWRIGVPVRVLLLAMVLIGAVLAWLSHQPRRRQRVIEAARRAGGYATLGSDHIPIKSNIPKTWRSEAARWLDDHVGAGVGREISVINLDAKPVTDAELAAISGLAGLRILYLNATLITDDSLRHVGTLTSLSKLELRETAVGDAGMAHLNGLRELTALYLHSTLVGDAGLAHLASLPKLRELHLGRTRVSDAGLVHLRGLGELQSLYLEYTNVSDAGLAALESVPNLRFISLEGTSVTDAGIDRLNQARIRAGLSAIAVFRSNGRLHEAPDVPTKPSQIQPDSYGFGHGELNYGGAIS
jgi:hypothetical protein